MKLGRLRNYHKGQAALRHYADQPVPYDLCISIPISCLLTVGSTPIQHSVLIVHVLNVKRLRFTGRCCYSLDPERPGPGAAAHHEVGVGLVAPEHEVLDLVIE